MGCGQSNSINAEAPGADGGKKKKAGPQTSVSLIETDELAALLKKSPKTVRVVNASWFYAAGEPDHKEQYRTAHIPGDVYFDISHVAEKDSGLLATIPTLETWVKECKRLGIKKNHTVVVYETSKIYAGPRVTWLFRYDYYHFS